MKYIFLEAYIPYTIIYHKISPVQNSGLGIFNNEWIKLRWINQIKLIGKCDTVDFH